jgi:hypothetical protein
VSAKNGAVAHVADVKRKIEQLPVGDARTKLELQFSRTISTLASKIRDAARAKR